MVYLIELFITVWIFEGQELMRYRFAALARF